MPKSGMMTWNVSTVPAKKIWRARSSVALSTNTPEPETFAERTPAPPSSSRQPPWLSRLVTSTVSALKLMRVALSPAIVVKSPPPVRSSLIRRSLPFCAAMSVLRCVCVRGRQAHAGTRIAPIPHVRGSCRSVLDPRPERQVDPPHVGLLDPPRARLEEPETDESPSRENQRCPRQRVGDGRRGRLGALEPRLIGDDRDDEFMLCPPAHLVRGVLHILRPDRDIGARHDPRRHGIVDRSIHQRVERRVRGQALIDRRLQCGSSSVTHASTSSCAKQVR